MKELAKRTGIEERTLEAEAERAMAGGAAAVFERAPGASEGPAGQQEGAATRRRVSRQELIAEDLLALALARNNFALIEDCREFFTPQQKEMYELLKSGKRKSDDQALDAVLGLIVLRDQTAAGGLSDLDVASLKSGLAQEYYRERRKVLALAVRNAEARGNDAELAAALAELATLPGGGE